MSEPNLPNPRGVPDDDVVLRTCRARKKKICDPECAEIGYIEYTFTLDTTTTPMEVAISPASLRLDEAEAGDSQSRWASGFRGWVERRH